MHATIVHTTGIARKVRTAGLDNLRIHLDEVDTLDAVIAGELPHDTAVTGTDDEDVLRVPVDSHRYMGDHLIVDELVTLGQHDIAIKGQHTAELRCFEDVDALVVALLRVELTVHTDAVLHIRCMKF